jgi:hypothetical protein
MMPLIDAQGATPAERVRCRVANTCRLLTTAAVIMTGTCAWSSLAIGPRPRGCEPKGRGVDQTSLLRGHSQLPGPESHQGAMVVSVVPVEAPMRILVRALL